MEDSNKVKVLKSYHIQVVSEEGNLVPLTVEAVDYEAVFNIVKGLSAATVDIIKYYRVRLADEILELSSKLYIQYPLISIESYCAICEQYISIHMIKAELHNESQEKEDIWGKVQSSAHVYQLGQQLKRL